MDESDWEQIVAGLRAEAERIAHIRRQWSSLQQTPHWSGPSEQAAWSQVEHATRALADIAAAVSLAEDDASRELARVRASLKKMAEWV